MSDSAAVSVPTSVGQEVMKAFLGLAVAASVFVLVSLILMACFNYAIVDGMDAKLSKLDVPHAMVLNILLSLFLTSPFLGAAILR